MTKTILILAFAVLAVSACGKKGKGSGTTAATVSYYQSDGACYETKSNKEVDLDKCNSVTYYMEYGSCYKKSNDDYVEDFNLCTKSLGEYFYQNGYCTDKDSNDEVSSNLCESTTTTTYGYDSNGYCIDKKTKKRVSDTKCEDDDDRYFMNGPICYDRYTEWAVDISKCQGSNDDNVCRGEYVKVDSYGYFAGYITCNSSGSNCRGQTLWNPRSGYYESCR